MPESREQRPRPARLTAGWLAAGVGAVAVAAVLGLAIGPVALNPFGVAAEVLNLLPGVDIHSGLTPQEAAIVTQLRLPRVVLGLLVGSMLALAGGCYQGVFRNPLADPYLLGVAAGAGLGATAAVALGVATGIEGGARASGLVPAFAFAGALLGVAHGVRPRRRRRPGADADDAAARRRGGGGLPHRDPDLHPAAQRGDDPRGLLVACSAVWPRAAGPRYGWCCRTPRSPAVVVLAHRRELDVLSVGDEEAASLGPAPAALPAAPARRRVAGHRRGGGRSRA